MLCQKFVFGANLNQVSAPWGEK